jgi:hypothetical protein
MNLLWHMAFSTSLFMPRDLDQEACPGILISAEDWVFKMLFMLLWSIIFSVYWHLRSSTSVLFCAVKHHVTTVGKAVFRKGFNPPLAFSSNFGKDKTSTCKKPFQKALILQIRTQQYFFFTQDPTPHCHVSSWSNWQSWCPCDICTSTEHKPPTQLKLSTEQNNHW